MKTKKKTKIEEMNGEELMNMIITLLAQKETIRLIFEKEEQNGN